MTSVHSTFTRGGTTSRGRTQSPATNQRRNYSAASSIVQQVSNNKHTSTPPLYPSYQFVGRSNSDAKYTKTNLSNTNTYELFSYNRPSIPLINTNTYRSNNSSEVDSLKYTSTVSTKIPPQPKIVPVDPSKNKFTSRFTIDNNNDKNIEDKLNGLNLNSNKNESIYDKDYKRNGTLIKNSNTHYYTIKSTNISPSSTSSVMTTSSSLSTKNNSIYFQNDMYSNLNGATNTNLNFQETSSNENENLTQKGFVGLKNLGNTCLSNTKFLLEYILTDTYKSDLNTTLSTMKGSLFQSYASLIKKMWKGNESVINPQEFRLQLIRYSPNFSGYAQQDAEEFLTYLIKGLHEDVNLIKVKPPSYIIDEKTWDKMSDSEKSEAHWAWNFRAERSRISDKFVGQLKSTLMCTKCDYRSPTYELFWDLAVPIPTKNPSIKLDDCIKLFMTEEILDGENKPVCSNCKEKRRCAKRYTIEKLPKILVIHLKRFLRARYNNKISLNVDYPIEGLDMSKYLSYNVDPVLTSNRKNSNYLNCVYDLYGISLHSGTESSGHYVAYSKNPYNKKWYCFNDQIVREISPSSLQSSNAYILFYQLRA